MSPQVTAAIIAASVGVLTVIATVAVQISGRRATSRDTQKAFEEQRKQLDRTLAEQRTRTLNERFATAAGQLGSDKPAAVRLAGVYAMAGLADDWKENVQTCVDVLCAYLRLPYDPDPGDTVQGELKDHLAERAAYQANREVRHTVIRVITAHLQADAAVSWQGLNFDFTGVVFDGGDFTGAMFTIGPDDTRPSRVTFKDATFSGGRVDFKGATFSGSTVNFWDTVFRGPGVSFGGALFSGGEVSFGGAKFSAGWVSFRGATFSGGRVDFRGTAFSGAEVSYGGGAKFIGGTVAFWDAAFSGSKVDFRGTAFSGSTVSFGGAEFSRGTVAFWDAAFSGGTVDFKGTAFSGSAVSFGGAEFSGGTVDFSSPRDWSFPPAFPWTDTPPPGVVLPGKEDQSHD